MRGLNTVCHVLLLSMVLSAPPLLAAPAGDARTAVQTRVAGLRELGAAFKSVNDALRSDQPQLMMIRMSARQIHSAARDQYYWFPAGSGPQAGLKTAAKPEIWTNPARFKAAQDGFAAQAAVFERTAAAGDLTAIRTEARNLGAACKACHDEFRTPQD